MTLFSFFHNHFDIGEEGLRNLDRISETNNNVEIKSLSYV